MHTVLRALPTAYAACAIPRSLSVRLCRSLDSFNLIHCRGIVKRFAKESL